MIAPYNSPGVKAGITAPVLAWLHPPGIDFGPALLADIQIAVSSERQLDELLVERTQPDLKQGDDLLFDRVMLVSQGKDVRIGQPTVDGAVVRSQVVAPVRGDKIIVFKKKRRKGYKKTQGHRQDYYRVRVESIEA